MFRRRVDEGLTEGDSQTSKLPKGHDLKQGLKEQI